MRQKFSGCHCTPRQKRDAGRSIASITPSRAVADDEDPRRDVLDRLVMAAVHRNRACETPVAGRASARASRDVAPTTATSCAMAHAGVFTW